MKNRGKTGTLAVLFVLLLAGMIFSCDNPIDDGTWVKAYGGEFGYVGNPDAVQLKDGSYITHGLNDAIVKLDRSGAVAWVKRISYNGWSTGFDRIYPTPDGGFLFSDTLFPSSDNPMDDGLRLIKFDRDGNPLWQKVYYGGTDDIYENFYALSVDETTGSIYAAGYIDQVGHVMKLDADGTLRWIKKSGEQQEYNYKIQAATGGGCVVLSKKRSSVNYIISRFDDSGAIVWKKSLVSSGTSVDGHETSPDVIQSIDATNDGGCILLGYKYQTQWVVKLDSSGNATWANMLTGIIKELEYPAELTSSSKIVSLVSIFQTGDGGYALSGHSYYNRYYRETPLNYIRFVDVAAWIIKLNAGGAISWQKAYRDKKKSVTNIPLNGDVENALVTQYWNTIQFMSLNPCSGGGFIAAGKIEQYTTDEYQNLFLFVTDENGAISDTDLGISALEASAGAINSVMTDIERASLDAVIQVEDITSTVESAVMAIEVTDI